MTGATLAETLVAAAAELEAVDATRVDAWTEWSIAGVVFAASSGDRAEFRLDPAVADAALRTPDTSGSARGSGWVSFTPAELDRHALDRAEAWLASAWRKADGET